MKGLLMSAVLATAILAGCGEPQANKDAPGAAAPAEALPAKLSLTSAPADAKDVGALMKEAKDGQRVVVHGVVGGREDPVAGNRAILTLIDMSVETCDRLPGDTCKTPWDACCVPADDLRKNMLTVQVVDAEGRPLKAPLTALPGLKPLARITVTGVARVTPDGVVLINADGIYVGG